MPVILYNFQPSPFSRNVLTGLKAMNITDIEMKIVNSMTGETKTPEFRAINPTHTVPVLVDGEFKLWERYYT